MKRLAILGILLVALFAVCQAPQSTAGRLQGEWLPIGAELGGDPYSVKDFDGAILKLSGHDYEFGGDKGTYTIAEQTYPLQMDIHGKEGPNAGRDIKAIFRLEGDLLTICYQLGDGERPAEFKTAPGTLEFLVDYKKK